MKTVRRDEAANVGSLSDPLPLFSSTTYDESDNRATYSVYDNGVLERTFRYVYDDADNLIQIFRTEGSNPEVLVESIDVDADGNMLSRTKELTGETIRYTWNAMGRLIKVSSEDDEGEPTSTAREQNRYNINGIRHRKLDKNGRPLDRSDSGFARVLRKEPPAHGLPEVRTSPA